MRAALVARFHHYDLEGARQECWWVARTAPLLMVPQNGWRCKQKKIKLKFPVQRSANSKRTNVKGSRECDAFVSPFSSWLNKEQELNNGKPRGKSFVSFESGKVSVFQQNLERVALLVLVNLVDHCTAQIELVPRSCENKWKIEEEEALEFIFFQGPFRATRLLEDCSWSRCSRFQVTRDQGETKKQKQKKWMFRKFKTIIYRTCCWGCPLLLLAIMGNIVGTWSQFQYEQNNEWWHQTMAQSSKMASTALQSNAKFTHFHSKWQLPFHRFFFKRVCVFVLRFHHFSSFIH